MKTTLLAAVAVAAVSLSASAVQAQQFVNVLTGGTSGVYFPLGVAIAKIYSDKIPNLKIQVQATQGSVENLNLIERGRGELAFTPGDSLKAAVEGDEDAGFKTKLTKLRTIGAIYPNYIQIVATADSGIKTLTDLKGKTLSVGAPKSGTELNSRAILKAAGLGYNDLSEVEYLPFAESVEMMKNRRLDATLQSAGLGAASLKDLSSSTDINVISVPKATVEKIGPPFVSVIIPANTYTGQKEDVPTAAVVNYLVTSAAVPDDLAYQMTKLIYESLPEIANSHAAAKDIKLETAATGSPAPLHPGAIRYYKEKGLISVCEPDAALKALDPKVLIACGDDFNIKGDLDRAIADYDAALKADPAFAEALNSRGLAWRAKGDRRRALADFDAALKLKPDYEVARGNRKSLFSEIERLGAQMPLKGNTK